MKSESHLAGALGAEQHPDAEEQDEARDPQAARRERRREAERKQPSGHQDDALVSHRGILLQPAGAAQSRYSAKPVASIRSSASG